MKKYQCNVCFSNRIIPLHTISGYPMCGGPTATAKIAKNIARSKIVLGFCYKCGSCSLVYPSSKSLANKIYDHSYTSSNMAVALGAKKDVKRNNFIQLVSNLKLKEKTRLLEIGCYDGSLLIEFKKIGFDVYGCEPSYAAEIGIKKYKLPIKKEYFMPDSYQVKFFDIIVLRNVFEHIPEPIKFLISIRKILKNYGKLVIEIPDGEERISKGILGSIVPEHPNYFSKLTLKMILYSTGFSRVNFKKHLGGISFIAKKNENSENELPLKLQIPNNEKIKKLKNIYKSGIKKNTEKNLKIRLLIDKLAKENRNIIVFGANTHLLELLVKNSIEKNRILYVVDDDPLKWGKKIVHFNLLVKSREALEGARDCILIICSYFSQDNIIDSLSAKIKKNNKIIKTYPKVMSPSY